MEGRWNIIRNNRTINNKRKKNGNSLIEVQLFFLIIIVLISFQLVIVNHRYKELINREEILGNYINRENYISAGEGYIKEFIINNNIVSEEDFRNKINVNFTKQTSNCYELEYERNSNRFILTILSSRAKYYYNVVLMDMNHNLIELTY